MDTISIKSVVLVIIFCIYGGCLSTLVYAAPVKTKVTDTPKFSISTTTTAIPRRSVNISTPVKTVTRAIYVQPTAPKVDYVRKRCCNLGSRMASQGIATCNVRLEVAAREFLLRKPPSSNIAGQHRLSNYKVEQKATKKRLKLRALKRCVPQAGIYSRCCIRKLAK